MTNVPMFLRLHAPAIRRYTSVTDFPITMPPLPRTGDSQNADALSKHICANARLLLLRLRISTKCSAHSLRVILSHRLGRPGCQRRTIGKDLGGPSESLIRRAFEQLHR